ncbi:MAG: GtrA family protein [Ruminococcus sp.]|nr:GtrA family protein [Ruminococcus sp.]MBQ2972529.1 GtrA family protein [Ruminococcus sp.]
MLRKLWDKFHEFIMYMVFGVGTTIVSWMSFAIFTKIVPTFTFAGITVDCTTTANVLSWICAVIFAYVTNKLWVFNSKSWRARIVFPEFGKFVSSRFITGVIEWVGLPLLIAVGLDQTIFGIEGMLAKITVSVVVIILNYVFSKLFIFKRKKTIRELTEDERKPTDQIIDEILDDIRNK